MRVFVQEPDRENLLVGIMLTRILIQIQARDAENELENVKVINETNFFSILDFRIWLLVRTLRSTEKLGPFLKLVRLALEVSARGVIFFLISKKLFQVKNNLRLYQIKYFLRCKRPVTFKGYLWLNAPWADFRKSRKICWTHGFCGITCSFGRYNCTGRLKNTVDTSHLIHSWLHLTL